MSIKKIIKSKKLEIKFSPVSEEIGVGAFLSIDLLEKTHNEIFDIIQSNESLIDKQSKLENLATPFYKTSTQLKFVLPSIIKKTY